MSKINVLSLNIPFGKYTDSGIEGRLELLKYTVTVHRNEDSFYLFVDYINDKEEYYCCMELGSDSESGGQDLVWVEDLMRDFLDDKLLDEEVARIDFLNPKNEDWLPTHHLARVYFKDWQ